MNIVTKPVEKYGTAGLFKITEKDMLIIKYIEKYGPREGIHKIFKKMKKSKKINFTYETTLYRFNQLIKYKKIWVQPILNYFRLGLEIITVLFQIKLKYANIFEEILKQNNTLLYYVRKYGSENGYLAHFAVPIKFYKPYFTDFLKYLKEVGIVTKYNLYRLENIIVPGVGFEWYDFEKQKLIFKWNEFLKEIEENYFTEKYKIEKPEFNSGKFEFPDEMDLKILEYIEMEPLISFKKISKELNVTVPLVKYHYDEHIMKYKYICKFVIRAWLFNPQEIAALNYALISFTSMKWRNAFIQALEGKPFIYSINPFLGMKQIGIVLALPYKEILNFNRLLWELAKKDIIEDYLLDTFDLDYAKRYTAPYELFKEGKWVYPHEEIIQKIQRILSIPIQI